MSATKDLVNRVRADVARDLKDHVVTAEGDGRWFCGKPKHSEYHFRVIASPGAILVHGDIGELILLPHDRDALAWLCGVLKPGKFYELDYPLSKVSQQFETKEFNADLAEEELAELEAGEGLDEDQRDKKFSHARDAVESQDGDAWDQALYEITEDCEFPRARFWTHRTLFVLECLRWFVAHLPEPAAAPTPVGAAS